LRPLITLTTLTKATLPLMFFLVPNQSHPTSMGIKPLFDVPLQII
jgi:hypothetical protein